MTEASFNNNEKINNQNCEDVPMSSNLSKTTKDELKNEIEILKRQLKAQELRGYLNFLEGYDRISVGSDLVWYHECDDETVKVFFISCGNDADYELWNTLKNEYPEGDGIKYIENEEDDFEKYQIEFSSIDKAIELFCKIYDACA